MGRLGGGALCFFEWAVACERIVLLKKELGLNSSQVLGFQYEVVKMD